MKYTITYYVFDRNMNCRGIKPDSKYQRFNNDLPDA